MSVSTLQTLNIDYVPSFYTKIKLMEGLSLEANTMNTCLLNDKAVLEILRAKFALSSSATLFQVPETTF